MVDPPAGFDYVSEATTTAKQVGENSYAQTCFLQTQNTPKTTSKESNIYKSKEINTPLIYILI